MNNGSEIEESNLDVEWPYDIRYIEFCQYSYAAKHNINIPCDEDSTLNDTGFVQRNIITGGYEWYDQDKKENVFHELFVTTQSKTNAINTI